MAIPHPQNVVDKVLGKGYKVKYDTWSKNTDSLRCGFCGGMLGAVEDNSRVNDTPGWSRYRTCMSCGHQWAEHYWKGLKRKQEGK